MPGATPLQDSVEAYLRACRARGVKPATIRNQYGHPLRSVLLPWAGEHGISDPAQLDQDTVDRFIGELHDRPGRSGRKLAPASVWTYSKAVRQYLAWLGESNGHASARIHLRRPPGRQVDVLDRDQIRALERAAVAERDRVIVRLLADTGMRPGELCSIRGEGLIRSSRQNYARVNGKTGPRDVPVSGPLFRRLQALARRDRDPIFVGVRRDPKTGEYEPLTPHGIGQMIGKLAEEAGIRTKVVPYTLRHSACRWMLLSGLSTIEVATIMGHGSERMIAQHYANIGKADVHDRLMQIIRAES